MLGPAIDKLFKRTFNFYLALELLVLNPESNIGPGRYLIYGGRAKIRREPTVFVENCQQLIENKQDRKFAGFCRTLSKNRLSLNRGSAADLETRLVADTLYEGNGIR